MMQKTQQTLPIIPWMGGKRRLAKHLLPMFPEHSCYVELFSGGAALFKDFRITQLKLTYTVGRDKTGKTSGELVICNW